MAFAIGLLCLLIWIREKAPCSDFENARLGDVPVRCIDELPRKK
jgi:hypothetical protein